MTTRDWLDGLLLWGFIIGGGVVFVGACWLWDWLRDRFRGRRE